MQEYDEKGRIKCDVERCDNRATVNYQTGTVRWTINNRGNYKFDELFTDDMENNHYCDEHDDN